MLEKNLYCCEWTIKSDSDELTEEEETFRESLSGWEAIRLQVCSSRCKSALIKDPKEVLSSFLHVRIQSL